MQVIITDIEASNGVIHVIDFVLLPPFSVTNNGAANLNFRAGPGLDQTIIDTFPIGAKGAALARSLDRGGQIGEAMDEWGRLADSCLPIVTAGGYNLAVGARLRRKDGRVQRP